MFQATTQFLAGHPGLALLLIAVLAIVFMLDLAAMVIHACGDKNKLVVLLAVFAFVALAPQPAHASVRKHALAKTAFATVKVVKAIPSVAKKSVKDTVGSILFATEEGVDVAHMILDGLDQITGNQVDYFGAIYQVIHGADYIAGEADQALEAGEAYFFGRSN